MNVFELFERFEFITNNSINSYQQIFLFKIAVILNWFPIIYDFFLYLTFSWVLPYQNNELFMVESVRKLYFFLWQSESDSSFNHFKYFVEFLNFCVINKKVIVCLINVEGTQILSKFRYSIFDCHLCDCLFILLDSYFHPCLIFLVILNFLFKLLDGCFYHWLILPNNFFQLWTQTWFDKCIFEIFHMWWG
jgi:hypothetical protein